MTIRFSLLILVLLPVFSRCQTANYVKDNYVKQEVYITMRDGVRLFTSIYRPKDDSRPWPFLMERTPYSSAPYGEKEYRSSLGPNPALMQGKYIFVSQDVRGRYMSEGQFQEMTPHREGKTSDKETDESTDTWDTIDWLLKNIANNNGRVGIWGISYPGFYASASLPDAHPALKAVSPQAPVTDEFIGDDANHNGAFFLMDNFDFDNFFDVPRPLPVQDYKGNIFNANIQDAYKFFLEMGSLKNTNNPQYFNNKGKIWNEYIGHSTYDAYWQARNIRPHLKNVKPATLVVGGWFDAEDLFGALRTYEAIEKQTPQNRNTIIMGPWTHGAWDMNSWKKFGILDFGQNVNDYYHQAETSFFNYYLKDSGTLNLPEATVFETGTNRWRQYTTWPPAEARPQTYYLGADGLLSASAPGKTGNAAAAAKTTKTSGSARPVHTPGWDEYHSDPANPVPYYEGVHGERVNVYMAADQRFAAKRPDVLVYQTAPLTAPLTVTGRLKARIFLSTTGTDADLVVKLIDVLPQGDAAGNSAAAAGSETAGYQRLVRAEIFRCKFRNSYEHPAPLVPGEVTEISFDLNEIAHTFKEGHRLMVQVQSSWFPLADRNPQQFLNIPTCGDQDFKPADIRIWHDAAHPSGIVLPVVTD